jgi:hypothetical protein
VKTLPATGEFFVCDDYHGSRPKPFQGKKEEMNDQFPTNEPFDRLGARRQRREARRAALGTPSRGSTWVAGLIMILLGVAFLLRTTGNFIFPLNNWWALFILIPAIGAFDSASRLYRDADNQITGPALGSLLVGLVLTLVMASFLFNLNWNFFGPILLILTGIGILAVAMIRRE